MNRDLDDLHWSDWVLMFTPIFLVGVIAGAGGFWAITAFWRLIS